MSKVVYTIGFSKKPLRTFIKLLKEAGVEKIIDTRLNNTSQLSGFSKKGDLEYILEIVGIDYEHQIELAPTKDILQKYKKKQISWSEYESKYNYLLKSKRVEQFLLPIDKKVCFLCSEHKETYCHRRLLVEYLKLKDPEVTVEHL